MLRFLTLALQCATSLAASPYDLIPPLSLDNELNYDFGGSTTLTRNEVRLTMENPGEAGYIVSRYDDELIPSNFELEFQLRISGGARNLYGDGMALFFLEELPGMGNLMGFNEFYKGVSLTLDTYRNGKGGRAFPRLLLMQNDGSRSYDMANDGKANEIDGCSMRGLHNNKRMEFATLKIGYSKLTRRFVVQMNYRNKWETCISADLDMGPVKRIAVSAATGELSDIHTVRKLQFEDYGSVVPGIVRESTRPREEKAKRDREDSEDRIGFFSRLLHGIIYLIKLFFKLFLLALAGLVLFMGWKQFKKFQQNKEDARFKLA